MEDVENRSAAKKKTRMLNFFMRLFFWMVKLDQKYKVKMDNSK
jgi:hypothetical protein